MDRNRTEMCWLPFYLIDTFDPLFCAFMKNMHLMGARYPGMGNKASVNIRQQ